MENISQNHGFQPSVIDENEHYVLGDGCLAMDILMPDSHGWGAFLPSDEVQNRNGLETYNCTNYGTLHALATLGKRKFGAAFQQNLSERYTGVMTGTTIYGNDPHRVIETIRKECGVIPEVYLPFDDTIKTWSDYYSPQPMKWSLYSMGIHWLQKYAVGHDWCFLPTDQLEVKQAKIIEALRYSPVGISVHAWSLHPDGKYYKDGPDNHWVCLYDFVAGEYWMIFDSYDNTHKKLDWNFNFGQGKRYTLDLNVSGAGPLLADNWMVDLGMRLALFAKSILQWKK